MKTKIKVEYVQAETKYSSAVEEEKVSETGKTLAYKIWFFLDTLSLSHDIIKHHISYFNLITEDGNIILSAIISAEIKLD